MYLHILLNACEFRKEMLVINSLALSVWIYIMCCLLISVESSISKWPIISVNKLKKERNKIRMEKAKTSLYWEFHTLRNKKTNDSHEIFKSLTTTNKWDTFQRATDLEQTDIWMREWMGWMRWDGQTSNNQLSFLPQFKINTRKQIIQHILT